MQNADVLLAGAEPLVELVPQAASVSPRSTVAAVRAVIVRTGVISFCGPSVARRGGCWPKWRGQRVGQFTSRGRGGVKEVIGGSGSPLPPRLLIGGRLASVTRRRDDLGSPGVRPAAWAEGREVGRPQRLRTNGISPH